MTESDPMGRPGAWKPVAGEDDWLVLMEHSDGFKTPRLVVSDQDEFFLKQTARALFPRDKLRTITDERTKKKFFVRKPA